MLFMLLARLTTSNTGLVATGAETSLPRGDVFVTIGKTINVGLGLLGVVVFGYILYAGVLWLTAGGKEETTKKASKIMVNAVIGALILLSSAAIANFVMSNLTAATYDPVQSDAELNDFMNTLDDSSLDTSDDSLYAPSYNNESAVW